MSVYHPHFTAQIQGAGETIFDLIADMPNYGRWLPDRCKFESLERGTFVARDLDLTIQIPGLLKLAEPYVVYVFRKENVRILAELKRYVEAQSKQRDLIALGTPEAHEQTIFLNSKEKSDG